MQVRTYLAIGAWAVLAVALAQQGQPRRIVRPIHQISPQERMDSLQTGIQAALDDLSMTKMQVVPGIDAKGRPTTYCVSPTFGLRRIPSVGVLHNGVLRQAGTPIFFETKGWVLEYFAVSSLGKPLAPGKMIVHKNVGPFAVSASAKESKEILAFADRACSAVGAKGSYKGEIDGSSVEARPLRLSKPECLPCHQGSKIGDPMAVLVCLVRKR